MHKDTVKRLLGLAVVVVIVTLIAKDCEGHASEVSVTVVWQGKAEHATIKVFDNNEALLADYAGRPPQAEKHTLTLPLHPGRYEVEVSLQYGDRATSKTLTMTVGDGTERLRLYVNNKPLNEAPPAPLP